MLLIGETHLLPLSTSLLNIRQLISSYMGKIYSTLRSKEAYVAPALELYTLHTGDLLVDPSAPVDYRFDEIQGYEPDNDY